MIHFFLLLFLFSSPSWAQAADPVEVIVTATRVSTAENAIGSSATVISGDEIRKGQKARAADLLRDVPGVSVSNAGGSGDATSVFLRGMNAEHTLVLLDGIVMNDPLSTTRAFDWGNFSSEDVERIEVIRGPQSVLYGSNAMGGVVQIFTRKTMGAPQGSVEAEYGAYRTQRVHAEFGAGTREFYYRVGAEYFLTEGFSAADQNLGNTEPDGHALRTLSLRLGGKVSENSDLDFTARASDSKVDNDATGGAPGPDGFGGRAGDDPNYRTVNQQFHSRLQYRITRSDFWLPTVAIAFSVNRSLSENEKDLLNTAVLHTVYNSYRVKPELLNTLVLSDHHTVLLGIETDLEAGTGQSNFGSGDSEARNKVSMASAYAEHQYVSEGLFSALGVRFDQHEYFGSKMSFRAAPGYSLAATGTTLRGSIGTGFKAPSLFQLFDATNGNAFLSPETNTGYDLGVDQTLDQNAKVSLTWFRNGLANLISYNFTSRHYENTATATTEGVEASLAAPLTRSSEAKLSYTYCYPRDESAGDLLLRRPLHQIAGEARMRWGTKTQATLAGRFVGARRDVDPVSGVRNEDASYSVFGVSVSYAATGEFKLFGRIENILDRPYEEVSGYGTAGRSVYVGLSKAL